MNEESGFRHGECSVAIEYITETVGQLQDWPFGNDQRKI